MAVVVEANGGVPHLRVDTDDEVLIDHTKSEAGTRRPYFLSHERR